MLKIKRFFYVGIISTIIDYIVYSVLIFFKVDYDYATIGGYFIGFIINFILTRKYVFREKKINNFKIELFVIILLTMLGLFLNIYIVQTLYENYDIDLYYARIVAIGLVFFFNYLTRKGFVYG